MDTRPASIKTVHRRQRPARAERVCLTGGELLSYSTFNMGREQAGARGDSHWKLTRERALTITWKLLTWTTVEL